MSKCTPEDLLIEAKEALALLSDWVFDTEKHVYLFDAERHITSEYTPWIPDAEQCFRRNRQLFPEQLVDQQLRVVHRRLAMQRAILPFELLYASFWARLAAFLRTEENMAAEVVSEMSNEHLRSLKQEIMMTLGRLKGRVESAVEADQRGQIATLVMQLSANISVPMDHIDEDLKTFVAGLQSMLNRLIQETLPAQFLQTREELCLRIQDAVTAHNANTILDLATELEVRALECYPVLYPDPYKTWDVIHTTNYGGSLRIACSMASAGLVVGNWSRANVREGDLLSEHEVDKLRIDGGAARAVEYIRSFVAKLDQYKNWVAEDETEVNALKLVAMKLAEMSGTLCMSMTKLLLNLTVPVYFARLLEFPSERRWVCIDRLAGDATKLINLFEGLDDRVFAVIVEWIRERALLREPLLFAHVLHVYADLCGDEPLSGSRAIVKCLEEKYVNGKRPTYALLKNNALNLFCQTLLTAAEPSWTRDIVSINYRSMGYLLDAEFNVISPLVRPADIGAGWEQYHNAYSELRARSDWNVINKEISIKARDMCTNILHIPEGMTVPKFVTSRTVDRLEAVLVGRRVVLGCYQTACDYPTLLARLGFITEEEHDIAVKVVKKSAFVTPGFRTYISEIGLLQKVILHPDRTDGLWPEERAWLKESFLSD